MSAVELAVPSDLSESSLADAAAILRIPMHSLTVYCGRNDQIKARQFQGKHGFDLVIVPEEILATRYTWGAVANGVLVYSRPSV